MDEPTAKQLVEKIARRAQLEGIDCLRDEEISVLLPWWAYGIISNGGFQYFFEGADNLPQVSAAFRALGFEKVAAACDRVQSSIFGDSTPISKSTRDQALARVEWNKEPFEAEENIIYEVSWKDLLRGIANYIDSHPAVFNLHLH